MRLAVNEKPLNSIDINITCSSDQEFSDEGNEDEFEDLVNEECYDFQPANYDLRQLFDDIQRQHHISQDRVNSFKRRYENYCLRNGLDYNENSATFIKCFRRYYGLNPERKSSDVPKRPKFKKRMRRLRRLIDEYELKMEMTSTPDSCCRSNSVSNISVKTQVNKSILRCCCVRANSFDFEDEIFEEEKLLNQQDINNTNLQSSLQVETDMNSNYLKTSRSNSKSSMGSRDFHTIRSSITFYTRSWQNKIDRIMHSENINDIKMKFKMKREKRLSLQVTFSSFDNLTKQPKRRCTEPALIKYERLSQS